MKLSLVKNGFTLIELGMVLVVVGLITGAVFNYMSHTVKQENNQDTIIKQRKITIALNNFAQNHGYLPCPSRTVAGGGTTDSPSIGEAARRCDSSTNHAQRYGIVPFKTLGLSQNDVIDGYGNPFSYVVSRSANHIPIINPVHKSETELKTYPACNDKPSGSSNFMVIISCMDVLSPSYVNYGVSTNECLTDSEAVLKPKIEAIMQKTINPGDYCLIGYSNTSGYPALFCFFDKIFKFKGVSYNPADHVSGGAPYFNMVSLDATPGFNGYHRKVRDDHLCPNWSSSTPECYKSNSYYLHFPWTIDMSGSMPVGTGAIAFGPSLQTDFSMYAATFPKALRIGSPTHNFMSGNPSNSAGQWSNQGALKKYFCCRDDVGSIEVRIPQSYISPANNAWVRATDTQSGLTGLGNPPDGTNTNQNLRYFAYVLISHGANGDGARIIGSSGTKPNTSSGALEQENANASSLIFYDWVTNSTLNNTYFDDIVLWRTQEQVIAELGMNSCRNP